MQYYKSFLVINPFGIGDVLFSTPLVRNLKENFPSAKIYYLCNRRTYPVLKSNPLIEKIFVYERDEFEAVKTTSKFLWVKKIRSFILEIKKENIDIAVDLSLNSQFGFFAWFAGIRKRIGLDYKKRGRFLTDKIALEGFDNKHVAEYYLDVLKLLNISIKQYPLQIFGDSGSEEWANNFINENNLYGKLIIGIVPCGGETFGKYGHIRRWPLNKFSLLAKRLNDEFNAKIFIFAGVKEKKDIFLLINGVRDASMYCHEFSDVSLEKAIALVKKCDLVIGNNTGLLRFADALEKKLIELAGPVDEKVYGPYPCQSHRAIVITKDLPCRPCYRRFRFLDCKLDRKCLCDISVDEVFEAAKKLLTIGTDTY